eukprot:scaffold386000_cov39-Prasinocladus_malaysianus.AAC.1
MASDLNRSSRIYIFGNRLPLPAELFHRLDEPFMLLYTPDLTGLCANIGLARLAVIFCGCISVCSSIL